MAGRDDISSLAAIPASGKKYARMSGLRYNAGRRKADLHVKMASDIVGEPFSKKMKSKDAFGKVPHSINSSIKAKIIVNRLLE